MAIQSFADREAKKFFLGGKLSGRLSIRINDQWRIVFRWTEAGPTDVEVRDYH